MAKNSNFLYKLDLIILSVLKKEDCYGYQLMKNINKKSNGLIVPKIGTIYPVLHEMLDKHYITSYEVYKGTKALIYYHIEDQGKEYLTKLISDYKNLTQAINSIIYD